MSTSEKASFGTQPLPPHHSNLSLGSFDLLNHIVGVGSLDWALWGVGPDVVRYRALGASQGWGVLGLVRWGFLVRGPTAPTPGGPW